MDLVDTHCHIQSIENGGQAGIAELWSKQPGTTKQVIDDAKKSGVSRLIVVGCDLDDSRAAIDLVKNQDNCWASIGIHPHEAKVHYDSQTKMQEFASLASAQKVVAVGECGLDYYYEHSPKEDQKLILEYQLSIAAENDLPVIFHVRDAFDDFWPIFDSFNKGKSNKIKGVLHSFTDSQANLERALSAGLMVGVNGIATFTKSQDQLDMYKRIPLGNLLLETDSPFLTPVPIRGSINEPKNVRIIAEFLAELRQENLETLALATTRNARDLFKI